MNFPKRRKINWTNITALALLHIGAVAALLVFNWRSFAVAVFLYWITCGLGISLGYHRLHTHRSYQAPRALDYFFALCGSLTLEGGPIYWVVTHRIHHQTADQASDPHSPRDGRWWAHVGWIIFGENQNQDAETVAKYAPDLAAQPFYVWLTAYHWIPPAVLGVLLLAVGGLPLFLWGFCVRVVTCLHGTWLANSAAHLWGSRRFSTPDDSRNNWWVALLTFGEGWHNNHHAKPASARHGFAWYELDLSWITLKTLRFLGLVKICASSQSKPSLWDVSPTSQKHR